MKTLDDVWDAFIDMMKSQQASMVAHGVAPIGVILVSTRPEEGGATFTFDKLVSLWLSGVPETVRKDVLRLAFETFDPPAEDTTNGEETA